MKKPDLIIVDDHDLFRQVLKSYITKENLANVIGEATDGLAFIELLQDLKPELVLMDIAMPTMDGVEATKKALELMPGLKIIVYTMFGEEEYYHKMIDLGVKGFILKSSGIDELDVTIHEVMMGNSHFCNLAIQKNKKANLKNKIINN